MNQFQLIAESLLRRRTDLLVGGLGETYATTDAGD